MRFFDIVNDNFRKNTGDIILPTRATSGSAGYDFYSPIDITIPPHQKVMIWSDVKVHMDSDNIFIINVRSSMGKQPIMIANTQGWIDSDYWNNEKTGGNIGFNLLNLGDTPYEIKAGDRIAQGMFTYYLTTDDDNAVGNRTGGFGSTN